MKCTVLCKLMLVLAVLASAAGNPMPRADVTSIDLAISYVEGTVLQDRDAYDISAYLMVVDQDGTPIEELEVEDFSATEDAQSVTLESLEPVAEELPIHVAMVMDASHSMTGDKITTARMEASQLIADLSDQSLVGLVTFGDGAEVVSSFTANQADVLAGIANIEIPEGAGSCLYDGIYEAVKMTASLQTGRRAVVVLADGEDEKRNGDPCSAHTSDDIITLATTAGTITPIFVIGLSTRVDEEDLKRIAAMTGGLFSNPETYEDLDEAFNLLTDQLNKQYVLRYVSTTATGAHTLAVEIKYKEDDDATEMQDNDTRQFLLPTLPVRVKIISPAEGQTVSGSAIIEAAVSPGSWQVSRVDFVVNDVVAWTGMSAPYQHTLDLASYESGPLSIAVLAYGPDGAELASASTSVTVEALTVIDEATTLFERALAGEKEAVRQVALWGGGALAVIAVLAIIIGVASARRRKQARAQAQVWDGASTQSFNVKEAQPAQPVPIATAASPGVRGVLIVEKSDDEAVIGQRFEIVNEVTNLGRSADNDVMFPKDTPVSRRHAQITVRAGGLYLSEVASVDESGQMKRSTYGTFVNGQRVEQEPVLLKNGDQIQLGARAILRLETSQPPSPEDEKTHLGFVSETEATKLVVKKK
ncbi:MAG: FHA domain-containing protein [Chloroflexota bacterium]